MNALDTNEDAKLELIKKLFDWLAWSNQCPCDGLGRYVEPLISFETTPSLTVLLSCRIDDGVYEEIEIDIGDLKSLKKGQKQILKWVNP